MSSRFRNLFWVAVAFAALSVQPALAQGPASAVEPIDAIVVGGQPFDGWFPNEFDPFHPKDLILDLVVTEIDGPGATGTLFWYFDWMDLAGGIVTTPPMSITLPGGASAPVFDTFRIPFCPQQVSLHLHSDGMFQVQGTFTHVCLPEPSSLTLLGLGTAMVLVRVARSNRYSVFRLGLHPRSLNRPR